MVYFMFAKLLMASTLELVLFTMSFAINNILSEANFKLKKC